MRGPAPVWLEAAGDGGAWRAALLGLHLVAAAGLLRWQFTAVAALAAAMTVGAAALTWRRGAAAPVRFGFDGEQWRVDGRAVQPWVALDIGAWLMLRVDGDDGRRQWLPLSASAAGARWPALRRALLAPKGLDRA